MSSISERFKIILKKKGITASEFSKIIDVQRSSISHIINGRNKPSLEIVTKVCRIYPDISLEWLINGNENKHTPTPFKESEKKKTKNEIDVEKIILLLKDGTFKTFNK